MQHEQDIVIKDIESDLYVAIDRAVDRAERAVARRLERQREHSRQSFKSAALASTASGQS
jgi:putative sigma-54 modulation protein